MMSDRAVGSPPGLVDRDHRPLDALLGDQAHHPQGLGEQRLQRAVDRADQRVGVADGALHDFRPGTAIEVARLTGRITRFPTTNPIADLTCLMFQTVGGVPGGVPVWDLAVAPRSNAQGVLDGDLNEFLKAYMMEF
jgi:hypothetical protein